MGNPHAELQSAERQAKHGNWRGARKARRLEKRRVQALGQLKKKSKKGQ